MIHPEAAVGERSAQHAVSGSLQTMRRGAALVLSVLAAGSFAPTVDAHQASGTIVAADTPHLQLGSQDAFVDKSDTASADAVLSQVKHMGARSWRILVQPQELKHKGWQQYDQGVDRAKAKGFNVNVTAGCNRQNWTKGGFDDYMSSLVIHFGSKVQEYSICNEPNYRGWLWKMPGLTLPETYRFLYQEGYKVVKKHQPTARVLIGEYSSHPSPDKDTPIEFMSKVATCSAAELLDCKPLVTDGVAYHPYQLAAAPDAQSNIPGEQGIEALPEVEAETTREFQAAQIATPRGKDPRYFLNEFGYWTPTRGENEDPNIPPRVVNRYISDTLRRQYYEQVMRQVCLDDRVARLSFYGFVTPTAGWPGLWNTALLDQQNKPLGSYHTIRTFAYQHPTCVRR